MSERETVDVAAGDGWKKDAALLALLVALVLPLRIWLLCTAEVAARDSIGYIRYALQFETMPWDEVLKRHDQHPGYSLAVLAVSEPLRWATGQTDAVTMQLAAQLTGMLASLLLFYPMYHLGRLLFDRRIGFGGALLYQYLPISGHHLSDGISETVFLLFVALALLQAIQAAESRSLGRFALCGLFGATAYLVRPEGGFVAIATIFVICAMQAVPSWRMSWRRFVLSGAALTLLTGAIGVGLVWGSGRLPKESVRQFFHLFGVGGAQARVEPQTGGAGGPLFALTFKKADRLNVRAVQSARALTLEVSNGYHYVGIVPALLGVAWSFQRLRQRPGFWVLAVYCTLHAATLFVLAMTVGYVSDRHTMTLVMLGSFFVVAGFVELSRRVLALVGTVGDASLARSPALWSAVLLLGLIGFCLPKTLQPLHTNREGNRAAGLWLAERLHDGDIVEDDHCWSHFYAGEVFKEEEQRVLPRGVRPIHYIVLTRSRDTEINHDRRLSEEKIVSEGAKLVYYWPVNDAVENARVVVYARPRDSANHP